MKKQEATSNLNDLKVDNSLGLLIRKAKQHINLNVLFQEKLPPHLKGVTLCLVQDQKVTLIAETSSIAFRAQKQKKGLLTIVKQVDGLSKTKSISIKVDKKKY